jgi:hypothetical protein
VADGADEAFGATDDTAATDDAGTFSLVALFKRSLQTLTSIKTAATDTATINVAQDTDIIKSGATSLTPKFAAISASTSGDNTIVAAVTGKKIRVLAYNLMGAGAVNARFQTAAAGAYLTGLKYIAAAGGGISAAFNPVGWFETAAGDLLNLELSGAVAVGGEIVYVEV